MSELGDVRRDERIGNFKPGIIATPPSAHGYPKACISDDHGKSRTVDVHVLVAFAFMGPRPAGMFVCHNDGSRDNNNWRNLRYDTPSGNVRDAREMGRQTRGEKHPKSKLSDTQIKEIRWLASRGDLKQAEIAAMYGVSQCLIWKIHRRLVWRHIPEREGFFELRDGQDRRAA